MIKAVFFDVDGTLVSFDTHRVPLSAVRAIRSLREKGIMTFISSGRRKADIDAVALPEMDGYITLNGGICLDGQGNVIWKKNIPPVDMETLIRMQDTPMRFPCVLVTDRGMHINFADAAVREFSRIVNVPFPSGMSREEWAAEARSDVYQMVSFFSQRQERDIMKTLPGCSAFRWYPTFADVVPKGVGKDVGMDHIMEHFGLRREETMAFGDGGNDVPMLRHAGIGVAMGNAGDEAKAAADYVTSTVDDHGVERALSHFGLL